MQIARPFTLHALTLQDYAIPALRVVIGVLFMGEAIVKLTGVGVGGFTSYLGSGGFPVPSVLAVVVIALELLGGLAILLGLFVRPIAALLTLEMIVALFAVHAKNGFSQANGGWEWPFAVFGGTLALALAGAGALSLDALRSRDARATRAPQAPLAGSAG